MSLNNKDYLKGGGLIAAILASVLYMEGGYVNNPTDPGGETNHGITVNVARSNGYTGKMVNLTKEEAINIYTVDYVKKPKYDLILAESPAVGHKLIDAGVNAGTSRSSCWFQKSLNSLNKSGADYPTIVEDCSLGPATVNSYKALARKRGSVKACELVIKMIDAQQTQHYMSLKHLSQFTVGWIDHRIGNIPLSYCKEYGK